jgi:hypothetical protein
MSDNNGQQQTMFETEWTRDRDSGPVTCLGMTFERTMRPAAPTLPRSCAKKLQDPEFRKIEGFSHRHPDEDIMNLELDPPYYTADRIRGSPTSSRVGGRSRNSPKAITTTESFCDRR